jgi:hypothetical protein
VKGQKLFLIGFHFSARSIFITESINNCSASGYRRIAQCYKYTVSIINFQMVTFHILAKINERLNSKSRILATDKTPY